MKTPPIVFRFWPPSIWQRTGFGGKVHPSTMRQPRTLRSIHLLCWIVAVQVALHAQHSCVVDPNFINNIAHLDTSGTILLSLDCSIPNGSPKSGQPQFVRRFVTAPGCPGCFYLFIVSLEGRSENVNFGFDESYLAKRRFFSSKPLLPVKVEDYDFSYLRNVSPGTGSGCGDISIVDPARTAQIALQGGDRLDLIYNTKDGRYNRPDFYVKVHSVVPAPGFPDGPYNLHGTILTSVPSIPSDGSSTVEVMAEAPLVYPVGQSTWSIEGNNLGCSIRPSSKGAIVKAGLQ